MRIPGVYVVVVGWALASASAAAAAETRPVNEPGAVVVCHLVMPDGRSPVQQASGLHFGRLGTREGLWLVCDRNAGPCGNQVLFIDRARLDQARPEGTIAVSESFRLAGPTEGWEALGRRHADLPAPRLAELRRQFEHFPDGDGPILDLEGITIGRRSSDGPWRFFLVSEQPDAFVLECDLIESTPPLAVLRDCFLYEEAERERGADFNDGLEGIAWSGRAGLFYLCEEGTAPHNPADKLHFWLKPRLMRVTLHHGRVVVDADWSSAVTERLWQWQTGTTHTLNALAAADENTLLAVDRNGGWIVAVEPNSRTVSPALGLYGRDSLDLRDRLARFPAPRRMPYVSIEGIARDPEGDLWLVDDPAIPESFRESCLVRVRRPIPQPATRPASRATP